MFGVTALAADMHRHVLDDTQDRHIDLAEHFDPLLGIQQGYVLGRGDNHRTRHCRLLRQGQLDIAGSRRHVDHQKIQLTPQGLLQHLHQGAARHGSAPDHRCPLAGQIPHGHGFQAMGHYRQQPLAILLLGLGTLGNAEHALLAGSVDIGIEQADAGTEGLQGEGEVDRGGRFADPALAGGDGDDVLDLVHGGPESVGQ